MPAVMKLVVLIDLVYFFLRYSQHDWKVLTFGASYSVPRVGAGSFLKLGGRQSLLFLVQDVSCFVAWCELSFVTTNFLFFSQCQPPFLNRIFLNNGPPLYSRIRLYLQRHTLTAVATSGVNHVLPWRGCDSPPTSFFFRQKDVCWWASLTVVSLSRTHSACSGRSNHSQHIEVLCKTEFSVKMIPNGQSSKTFCQKFRDHILDTIFKTLSRAIIVIGHTIIIQHAC